MTSDPPGGWRNAAGMAAMLFGLVAMTAGLGYTGMYIHGVIEVLREPDKSWIFWGLAILFIGLVLTAVGAAALVWGNAYRRR
jgi:hypothetical protein